MCAHCQAVYEWRLGSLLDMIDGQVIYLCHTVQQLQCAADSLGRSFEQIADLPEDLKDSYSRLFPFAEIERLEYIHQDFDLSWRVKKLQNQLRNREFFSAGSLARELDNLRDQLLTAVAKFKFAHIPPASIPYFEQEELFGHSVFEMFPDIRQEIKDVGNSFSVALYSACVFHSMRVAEHGMRHLARRLRVSLKDNKKPLPIVYATWDKLITGIKNKLDQLHKNPKGKIRDKEQEIYSSIADQCTYFRDIWRDRTMHSRKSYSEDEAFRALQRVRDFMQLLGDQWHDNK